MDKVLNHRNIMLAHAQGAMDKARDLADMFFSGAIPNVQLFAARRGDFVGHYFLEKTLFVVKRSFLLEAGQFVRGGLRNDLPRSKDYLIGNVTGTHRVADARREYWAATYDELYDALERRNNRDEPETNFVVCADRVGLFDEEGKLHTVVEVAQK